LCCEPAELIPLPVLNKNSLRTNPDVLSYQLSTEVLYSMRDPFLAGVLSLIVPGVGQLYNGRILAGILWLIITPGFWIGSGGTLGWICHVIAAWCAYSYAKDHPVR
jgi:TM2 domain-containing membrane protein YozV